MNCCLLNVRSMNQKYSTIKDIIIDNHCNLSFLTETWLTDKPTSTIARNLLCGDDFELVSKDRKGKSGGGVAVVCRLNELAFKEIQTATTCCSFEFLCGRLIWKTKTQPNTLVLLLYRPPALSKSLFIEELERLLAEVSMLHENILVCGDVNLYFDMNEPIAAEKMNAVLHQHRLSQALLHTIPTHDAGHSIDFVASSLSIRSVSVQQLGVSDHSAVFFTLPLIGVSQTSVKNTSVPHSYQFRNFKSIAPEYFRTALKSALERSTDRSVTGIDATIRSVLDDQAPLSVRKSRSKQSSKVFSGEIQNAKRVKRRFERLVARHNLVVHRQMLKAQVQLIRKLVLKSEAERISGKIADAESNTSALFKIVDGLTSSKAGAKLPCGAPIEVATALTDYFVNKIDRIITAFTEAAAPPFLTSQPDDAHSSLPVFSEFQPISEENLAKLCKVKASSMDVLPTSLYRDVYGVVIPYHAEIVNNSLTGGCFPHELKTATVTPLLKSASLNQDNFSSYRPISVLPHLSKVVEKAAACQFVTHIESNGLLHARQSAYRKGHSVETALLQVSSSILKELDDNRVVFLAMLDLSAAFDTLGHTMLIGVLRHHFGVEGSALAWFTSYLADRSFRVKVGDHLGPISPLKHGVPQGSVLGPILFNCMMTDLMRSIEARGVACHSYADDTQLWVSFDPRLPGDEDAARLLLTDTLAFVSEWMNQHHLKLNQEKTVFIPFHRTTAVFASLSVGGVDIEPSVIAKNLGVWFDTKLDFKHHVSNTLRSCYFHLRRLQACKPYIPAIYLPVLVHAFITSRLDFCNSILYGLPSCTLSRLQKVQNAAAKFLTGARKFDSASQQLQTLHWLPIKDRILFKVILLSHSIATTASRSPAYFTEFVVARSCARATRSSKKAQLVSNIPVRLKTYGERSMFHSLVHPFNALPSHLCNHSDSYASFKTALKTFLFCNAFR